MPGEVTTFLRRRLRVFCSVLSIIAAFILAVRIHYIKTVFSKLKCRTKRGYIYINCVCVCMCVCVWRDADPDIPLGGGGGGIICGRSPPTSPNNRIEVCYVYCKI